MCWVSGGWVSFMSILISSIYALPPEYSCPANEAFTLCVIPCNTCEGRGRCEPAECIPGCDCLPGFFRSEKYHQQCVPEVYCKNEAQLCPANEEVKDCVVPCNDCNLRGQCHFEVCTPGCDCVPGYYRSYEGTCIPAQLCPPPICPPDEIYYDCLPTCRDTCDNFHLEGPCPMHCRSGCHCKEGYVKNKYGKCVTPSECPPPSCGHYERYSACADPCKICDPRVKCTHTLCHPGCECEDGYRRDSNGICVLEEQCPGIRCGPYETYTHCASLCNTCYDRGNCSFYSCSPGCDCIPGYLRNESAVCVPESQCPLQQVCRPDQQYYTCIPDCRNTCDAYLDPTINCPATCRSGCFCREGFFSNSLGQCVPPKDCIPTAVCRSDEQHYPCIPDCKNTCRNYFNPNAVCPAICKPGCFCFEGLVRNNQGQCVYPDQCELDQNFNCGPDEVYVDTCVRTCDVSCEAYLKPVDECFAVCTSGCYCKKGLYRSKDGKCVLPSQCTLDLCKPDEQYYQCVPDCKYACENINKPGVVCTDKCRAGCFCKEGLYHRQEDGRCVPQSECRIVQCQPLEQYYSCYTLCNGTCETINNPYFKCSGECKSGCFCLPQYVKRRDGQCVLPSQCEIKTCPNPKERFYDCVPDCTNTCEKHTEAGGTCPVTCKSGCFCKEGLLKRKDGECVPPEECVTKCGPLEKFYECYSDCSHTCSYIHTPSLCNSACKRGCYCLPGLVRGRDGRCVHPFMCFNRILNIFGRGGLNDETELAKNETTTSATPPSETTRPSSTTSVTKGITGRKTPTETKPEETPEKPPVTATTSKTGTVTEPTSKTTAGKPQTTSTTITSKSPTTLPTESKNISGRSRTVSEKISTKNVPKGTTKGVSNRTTESVPKSTTKSVPIKSTIASVQSSGGTSKSPTTLPTESKDISGRSRTVSEEISTKNVPKGTTESVSNRTTESVPKSTTKSIPIMSTMAPVQSSEGTPLNVSENTTSIQKVSQSSTTSSTLEPSSSSMEPKSGNETDGVISRSVGAAIKNETSNNTDTTAEIKETSVSNTEPGNTTSSVSTTAHITAVTTSSSGTVTTPTKSSTTNSISARSAKGIAEEKEKVTSRCSKNSPTEEPLSARSALGLGLLNNLPIVNNPDIVSGILPNVPLQKPGAVVMPSILKPVPLSEAATIPDVAKPKPIIEDKKVTDSVGNILLPMKSSAQPPLPKVPLLTPVASTLETVDVTSFIKPTINQKSSLASVNDDNTKERQTGSLNVATTIAATKLSTKGVTNSGLSGRSGNQDSTIIAPVGTTFSSLHKSTPKSTIPTIEDTKSADNVENRPLPTKRSAPAPLPKEPSLTPTASPLKPVEVASLTKTTTKKSPITRGPTPVTKKKKMVPTSSSSINQGATPLPGDIKTPKFITAADAPQMETENDDILPTTPVALKQQSPAIDVTEKETFSSGTTKGTITKNESSFSGRSKSEEETEEKMEETEPPEIQVPLDHETGQTEAPEVPEAQTSSEVDERQTDKEEPIESLISETAEPIIQNAEERNAETKNSDEDVTPDITDTTEKTAYPTDPIRTKREIRSSTHIPNLQRTEAVRNERLKSIASSYHGYGVPSSASKTVFPTTLSGPFVTLLLILFSASNSSISGSKQGTLTIRKDVATLLPGVTRSQDIITTKTLEEILQGQYSPMNDASDSKDNRGVVSQSSPNTIIKGSNREGGIPVKV